MKWIGALATSDLAPFEGLFAVIGGASLPATPAAMKAARIAVGQTPPMVNIALGAVGRALTELKGTGRIVEARKTALGDATSDKVEQVEELNARSAKYNLPRPSAREQR